MIVYNAILNQLFTMNISLLMDSLSRSIGAAFHHVPHCTTVEQMAIELGVFAHLQCAEAHLANSSEKLAFDAPTQERAYLNALVITTEKKTCMCYG